jgi:predicted O-methyltransferase YrrM
MDRAARILKRLEAMGEHEFIPSIGPIKGRIIEQVIAKHGPKRILEIGTLYGYSAILMARLVPKEGRVVTVEVDEDNTRVAENNIREAGLSDKIEILVGDALEIIPMINGRFDLLFIDAVKDDYLHYLKLAEKNLGKGSIVIADNVGVFAEEVKEYLRYVRGSEDFTSETVDVPLEFSEDIIDAMEISIRK